MHWSGTVVDPLTFSSRLRMLILKVLENREDFWLHFVFFIVLKVAKFVFII